MSDWLLDGLFEWLATQLTNVLSWLMEVLTDSIFTSPDVTVLPQVRALTERATAVVHAVFVVAILVAALLTIAHGSVQVRYELKDLLPRLLAGLGLSAFAEPLCRGVIEVANATTTALVGETASGPRVVTFVQQALEASENDPAVRSLTAIIALTIVVLIFQLVLSWVFRFFTLFLVAGLAPVALATYALPQTQPAAQLWWRSLLGALVTPALQGLAFSVGVDVLINPDHTLPVMPGFGIPGSATTTVMNLFMVMGLLVVTVRIPRLVARYALHQGSTGTAGVVVRAVVIQTVLRRAGIRGLSRLAR